MKNIKLFTAFFIIVGFCSALVLSSCSDWGGDKDKFINAYKDVLTIRLMYPDTLTANRKVNSILQRYGFTKRTFSEKFEKYSSNPEEFRIMIDSARERAKRDYIKIRKDKKLE